MCIISTYELLNIWRTCLFKIMIHGDTHAGADRGFDASLRVTCCTYFGLFNVDNPLKKGHMI